MNILEIVLLAAGALAFVSSFFLPDKSRGEKAEIPEEELKRLVEEEIENNRGRIGDMTEESVNYQVEKTERNLDRLTNEKMMALGEYSDNVMSQIGSNHQEVVFLHDMLNRSKNELEDLLNRAERESKEANERANAAYTLAENARKLAEEVMEKAEGAANAAVAAEEKMLDARRLTQDMQSAPATVEEQPKEDGFQAKELKELVAAHEAAVSAEETEPLAGEDLDELLRQAKALGTENEDDEETDRTQDVLDAFASASKQQHNDVDGQTQDDDQDLAGQQTPERSIASSSEEELQALLDNAMNAAPAEAEPVVPVAEIMKVDPEEERFFEDTQEQEAEDDEDEEDELSEEEMMEKLLREATAELAHDVSRVSAAADKKKVVSRPEVTSGKEAAESGSGDAAVIRTSVKRRVKPKAARKTADDDEIEGQMSIPEEFMPGAEKNTGENVKENTKENSKDNKNIVALQFGHEDDNSANHNERILQMHRMGRSNMAIAKDLGLGIGEVKLVIDLFENMS